MAIVPNFSVSQILGNSSTITLQDTSTGSDTLIVSREVVITNAASKYITANGVFTAPTSTVWALANTSTSINCLPTDMALYVRVNWLSAGGTVLYTKITLFGFYSYTNEFLLRLTKNQIPDPRILADTNYWNDKEQLHTLLKDAINAVSIGGDIYSAQNSLNMATYLMVNSANFF